MDAARLPLAVRTWTNPKGLRARGPSADEGATSPRVVLVFDTETTVDATQRLTFGAWASYAVPDEPDELEGLPDWHDYQRVDEGLFYADDLDQFDRRGLDVLRAYVQSQRRMGRRLRLQSRSEWMREAFHPLAFTTRALVVGFNLPFDLSRIAYEVRGPTRRRPRGFSFVLSTYEAEELTRPNQYRPRLTVQSIDSKRAFIEFESARDTAEVDLLPDESSADPDARRTDRGRFLDLRTLCFALTDRSHSLASACEAFAVEHAKQSVEQHGTITPDYIDYCRRDVLATWELYCKAREEYERHQIRLPPTKAWSPASVGKAYLDAMGIRPILQRQPNFSPDTLGKAMVAYYGGRAECRIRRSPVPVVYVDFLSMYPTVNTLMGTWRLLTARRVDEQPALDFARSFLDQVESDDLFRPETWGDLACLVLVQPDGDVLPARAKYDLTGEWQIGVNPLTSDRPL